MNVTPTSGELLMPQWVGEGEGGGCVPGEEYVPVPIPPDLLRGVRSWLPLKHITPAQVALKVTFYVVVMAVDVVGNSLVILLVSRDRQMRSPTNVLLVNLAAADLLLCMLGMWVHLGSSLSQDWPFGLLICKVNMFAQVVAISSSVMTLTVISVERFLAIVLPLRQSWSLRKTCLSIAAVWLIACSIASPQLHVRHLEEYQFSDRHVILCREQWPQVYLSPHCDTGAPHKVVYHVVVGVVLFLVPIIIMAVSYSVICVCLLVRKAPSSSSSSSSRNTKKKVVRMLVIVMVVFVVCWTPLHILEIIPIFHPERKATEDVIYAALFIGYTNSALNPIMYAGFNDNFRKGFQQMFPCHATLPPFSAKSIRVQPHEPQPSISCVPNEKTRHLGHPRGSRTLQSADPPVTSDQGLGAP